LCFEGAGYTPPEIATIKQEVDHFEKACTEVKLASGDYIDLKMYEPAMRHLIDTYIRAEESEKISAFDDMSLVQLIVERGADVLKALPKGIAANKEAVAETIENNLRRVIVDEQPINPKYYEKMSELLDALIKERREEALAYEKYLAKIVALTKNIHNPGEGTTYPKSINSPVKRALYDNLEKDAALLFAVDRAVLETRQDDWRGNPMKVKMVRIGIKNALLSRNNSPSRPFSVGATSDVYFVADGKPVDPLVEQILELVKNQNEY
jgi:type I restriction enzyme R subunit